MTIFFAISGFLVARSWDLNPRLSSFAAKRALRLMPGLIVALLFSAFVIGPLMTTLSLGTYLTDSDTWTYVLHNAALQSDYDLPGVFTDNAGGASVNGSLWTLPVEAKAYLLLAVVGLIGLLVRRRWVLVVFALCAVAVTFYNVREALPFGRHYVAFLADIEMPSGLVNFPSPILELNARLVGAFFIGAAFYALRRRLPLLWPVAGALFALLVAVVAFDREHAPDALMLTTPYIVLTLAYRTSELFHLPRWWGDYSYGIYVYAFPVQQTLIALLAPMSSWVLFLLATPLTTALAVASWHFVEKPALRFKRAFGGSTSEGLSRPARATPPSG